MFRAYLNLDHFLDLEYPSKRIYSTLRICITKVLFKHGIESEWRISVSEIFLTIKARVKANNSNNNNNNNLNNNCQNQPAQPRLEAGEEVAL